MTRCVTCGSLVHVHTSPEGTSSYVPLEREPRDVVIYDEGADELITNKDFPLADGGVLKLRVGRGKITREGGGDPAPVQAGSVGRRDTEDDSDQACAPTRTCVKWGCDKAPLRSEGEFYVCQKCGSSYGRQPHPDLPAAPGHYCCDTWDPCPIHGSAP